MPPTIIVIFGITGDLAQRYLLPALYHLIKDGQLDEQTEIVGITRQDLTAEQLLEQVDVCVHEIDKTCDPVVLEALHKRLRLIQMDPTDPLAYTALQHALNAIEDQKGLCLNRLYYLSIPPQLYRPIIRHMGEAGLNASCQHGSATSRLLVEKPFGYDLASAEALISETGQVFSEAQVFRIDHFLAKRAVQNILAFRAQNTVFENVWNQEYIASVEIAASEQIGIEGRAKFYDPLGALRDFIQNHLLQLLAITTIEPLVSLDSDELHAAKQHLLEKVRPVPADKVRERAIRGQYNGYPAEVGNPDSATETYAGLTLFIDDQRWQGMPFRIWTGKALAEKKYQITVNFREDGPLRGGQLRFNIQPQASIVLELPETSAENAGQLQAAVTDFAAQQPASNPGHPEAYERLILDAANGNHSLFASRGEVLASWRIVQPVLDSWAGHGDDLIIYQPGTPGPLPSPPSI